METLSYSVTCMKALRLMWISNSSFRDIAIQNYSFITSTRSGFFRTNIPTFDEKTYYNEYMSMMMISRTEDEYLRL